MRFGRLFTEPGSGRPRGCRPIACGLLLVLLAACLPDSEEAQVRKDTISPETKETPMQDQTRSPELDQEQEQAAMRFTGTVVPGVTCPALDLGDGRVIALSWLPPDLVQGTRITVTGSGFAGSATCQQEVFVVSGATRAP